jgi:hypothetical protein
VKRTFWAGVFALLVVVAGAGIIWWMMRQQVIVLDNGTKLTLLGVTYGQNNILPGTTILGKHVGARLYNTNKTAVAWILAQHESSPTILLLAVSDGIGTEAAISQERSRTSVQKGAEIFEFNLNSFPSRDRKMILRVFSYGDKGLYLARGRFIASNPNHGPFPQWKSEPIPDIQSDGDLDVTLTNLNFDATPRSRSFTGVPQNDSLNQALNKTVEIGFYIKQKGVPATNWSPEQIAESDATGNNYFGGVEERDIGNQPHYFFLFSPWPNEPVWKLRMELSKTSSFNSDELWTIPNIPVTQGTIQDTMRDSIMKNRPVAQADINGVHVKVYPAIQYEYPHGWAIKNGNRRNVTIVFSTEPVAASADMSLTVVSVTDDQGHTLNNPYPTGSIGISQRQFADTNTIQSLDVTLAVSKSRFVEFTVSPKQPAGL